ncbi:MAG TPA: glycerol-3-phosphate dehydrogenase/oxidase [Thermoanaerobaculia bacterium]|nr:glycerol-3-phosphate dehydrogenase/oxidase [Thermoanaerobaculia bacterium]
MNRAQILDKIRDRCAQRDPFDFLVVGGGATGVGIAVDAASRGHRAALVEQSDFGKGTSSRSTKLVHGGVRYLQQGNVSLVMEALKERGLLRRNAPHLVHDLPFVVPNYAWWEAPFYGIGMKVYDALAGRYGFGESKNLSRSETVERLPTIETEGLRGGVIYHDGQFDDARLLINLVSTAVDQGALPVNYVRVTELHKSGEGYLRGASAIDLESGESLEIPARCVINATGAFADGLRRLDDPDAKSIVRPSQGIHLVLPKEFLPGDSAIMVPHTDDGRVLFAIPWHGVVVVGTTDTPIDEVSLEPQPLEEEIDFLLEHAARYLDHDPSRDDVLSVFAGIRPLVANVAEESDTAKISREHSLAVSASGMLTVAGGKWTTYRKMAEDAVDLAETIAGVEASPCVTRSLNVHGHHANPERFGPLADYGSDAPEIETLAGDDPALAEAIHPRLKVRLTQVVWAVREEMARTVDDVLARRTRSLLLDARAAGEAAAVVARAMARELRRDDDWVDEQVGSFRELARGYLPSRRPK